MNRSQFPEGGEPVNRKRTLTAVAVALLLAVGCGKPVVPAVAVGGAVSLDGKPVSNAVVVFYSAEQAAAPPVSATVTDGRFSTALPLGRYKVAVRSAPATPDQPVSSDFAAPKAGGKTSPPAVPAKYAEPTLLTADVTGERQELAFSLKSR